MYSRRVPSVLLRMVKPQDGLENTNGADAGLKIPDQVIILGLALTRQAP